MVKKYSLQKNTQIDRERDFCFAKQPISDENELTLFAIGGFADLSTPITDFYCPEAIKKTPVRPTVSTIAVENDYRMATLFHLNQFYKAYADSHGSFVKASRVGGMSKRLFDSLCLRFPILKSILEEIYDGLSHQLESEAYRRAVEGVDKKIYYQGVECGIETVYSDSLLTLLLQARISKFKAKSDVTLKGDKDNPLYTKIVREVVNG